MRPNHNSQFITTVAVAALIGWGVWIYTLTHLPPDKLVHNIFFLASFYFALASVITMVLYKLAYHQAQVHHSYINAGAVLNHCFRRAGILSGVVTVAASLKILGAFSALNFGLLLLSAFFAEVYFMQKH